MPDALYVRVGNALGDSFLYLAQNPARTRVTGKVDANFTKRLSKDGVGNQSTTGVTITEVDATNNPGEYAINVTGAAFPAVAGRYVLTVFDTASPQYVWQWTWIVTSDGTASAPVGPALFTAVAGNGRVTDGVSPILGATVIVRTATGALYYTAQTDASGLWGSVNFPSTNATYTAYVIRSGYQQVSGTISVVAGVATGPGSDLVMAAAAAANGLSASELWAYARRMMFGVTGTQADTEVKQAVGEALERVATVRRWPWYRRHGQLALNGAYATGTIALVQGSSTITLTGGTFPTWATSSLAKVRIGNQIFRVLTRTSGTQLVLDAAWVEASNAAATYTLYQDEYALPSDLYRFGELLPGPRWGMGPIPTSPEALDQQQNAVLYGQKFSGAFAIQGQNVVFSQYPSQDTVLFYSYYARPADLVSGTDVADWDPAHKSLIRRAIDVEVALRYGKYAGGTAEQAFARFDDAFKLASKNDRTEVVEAPAGASSLGSAMDRATLLWKRLG